MPCIIALIVFGILGIFSASHRSLAKEAFSCVFRRITFRPCQTGFQEKIKGKILGNLIKRSVFWTKVVNKNYELLSWIFFLIFVGSTAWALFGGYNYYVYGSCNGLNESGFCVFDPSGKHNEVSDLSNQFCGISLEDEKNLSLTQVDLNLFPKLNLNAKNYLFFIGCYACDYSRQVYPEIQKLIQRKKVNYIFAHYPSHVDDSLLGEVAFCIAENYLDDFWTFNDYLFTEEKEYVLNQENLPTILDKFNFDNQLINKCLSNTETKVKIQEQIDNLNLTNIYGTPTIFIKNKAYVGPKPLRVYRSALNKFIFF